MASLASPFLFYRLTFPTGRMVSIQTSIPIGCIRATFGAIDVEPITVLDYLNA